MNNVIAMTTIVLNDIKIIMVGERHSETSPGVFSLTSIGDIVHGLDGKEVDIFLETHIKERTDMKDRYHAIDLRSKGLMSLIEHLDELFKQNHLFKKNQKELDELFEQNRELGELFKQNQEPYLLLDIVVDVVAGEYELAKKIYHTQLRHVNSPIIKTLYTAVENDMVYTIELMREKAEEGKWENEGDEYGVRTLMNDIVDWFINMYGLLRASRTGLATHRLIYFGEHHRRQIVDWLRHLGIQETTQTDLSLDDILNEFKKETILI
jgi:hypothetical protein